MKVQEVLSRDVARRRFFVHPPEPEAEAIEGNPAKAVYVARTKIFGTPFVWNHESLVNPHIAVVGITGSGKSFFVKTLVTRASLVWGTNALIIDWAGEYAEWVRQAGGKVFQLGKGTGINLLSLGGMKPLDRAKQVVDALELLTDLKDYPGQKRVTLQAIEEAYARRGFTLHEPSTKTAPTLKDVQKILEKKKLPETEGALYRVRQFTAKGNDFFAQDGGVNVGELVSGLACADLSGLPNETLRSLAGLTILQFVREKMRLEGRQEKGGLKLFIVLDEAWKICQDSSEETDPIVIVREGRKYAFGLIVASQNPTDISKKIFSNVGTTFVFRVKHGEYADYLQESLRFSNHVREQIRRLGVGECAVNLVPRHAAGANDTFLLKKVEGEELLEEVVLDGGEAMPECRAFEKNELGQLLKAAGLGDDEIAEMNAKFREGNGHMNAVPFVLELEKRGVPRTTVTILLKDAGIADRHIMRVYSKADERRTGMQACEMVLE